jgi:hypothetical protein
MKKTKTKIYSTVGALGGEILHNGNKNYVTKKDGCKKF